MSHESSTRFLAVALSSALLALPLCLHAHSLAEFHDLSPDEKRAYMDGLSEQERQAKREQWRAERDAMSDEERAAMHAERMARREEMRARWNELSEEEKAARREAMLPEPVLLDDRTVETHEQRVRRLRDLQPVPGPQEHVNGRPVLAALPAARAVLRLANSAFRIAGSVLQLPAALEAHAGRDHVTDGCQLRRPRPGAGRQQQQKDNQFAGDSRHR